MLTCKLCDLLDLKQKQANIQEARSARKMAEQSAKQAESAAKQGRTVMLFTVVTIIFVRQVSGLRSQIYA